MDILNRTEMLIGLDNIEKLKRSHILVFGLGGVGGALCEALCRSGIGEITIVDRDKVDKTNINRQIIATQNTINMDKTEAMSKRLKSINPDIKINQLKLNLDKETINDFQFSKYDYVADAIDTVSSKILLAELSYKNNFKLISAMGAGNRLDPSKLKITDIYKTNTCPLARVMRRELRKRQVKKLTVVCSSEEPLKPKFKLEKESAPGSISFVPPVSGMLMASYIVREIIDLE